MIDEFNKKIQESLQSLLIRVEFKKKAIEKIKQKIDSIKPKTNGDGNNGNNGNNGNGNDGKIALGLEKIISSI